MKCSTSGTPSSRSAVRSVLNLAIRSRQAASYASLPTASRTYAFSSFSTVLMSAYRSAKLSYFSRSPLVVHSATGSTGAACDMSGACAAGRGGAFALVRNGRRRRPPIPSRPSGACVLRGACCARHLRARHSGAR